MNKNFRMNYIDWTVLALVIVGAINWGLVGIAYFVDASANWNLVNLLLGSVPEAEFAVYLIVGLAGLYAVYFASRITGVEMPEPEIESETRRTPK